MSDRKTQLAKNNYSVSVFSQETSHFFFISLFCTTLLKSVAISKKALISFILFYFTLSCFAFRNSLF